MAIKVISRQFLGYLKIYINNILFVKINLEKFTGLQSYINNGTYHIEIYSNGQMIHLEFNEIEKWKKVLDIFDNL